MATIWRHEHLSPLDPVGSRVSDQVVVSAHARVGDVVPDGCLVWRNAKRCARDDSLEDGDHVSFVRVAEGPATWLWLADYIINAVIAAAVGFVVSKLFAPPKPSARPEDNESGTYGWSGLRTTYNANGAAIPVVIGEHDVGGLVIGQWVESQLQTDSAGVITDQRSVLRLLLLLCQGPVHSIGGYTAEADNLTGAQLPRGMKVNGNAAENFAGVKAFVRIGELYQTAIPGFDALRKMYSVGLLIDNATSAPAITDWSLAAAFDLEAPADHVIIGIGFPFGLYNLSGSSLASEQVDIEVRYVELDGGGSPTGPFVTPAFFADGSTNPIAIRGAVQGELVKQLPLTLYDPATFVAHTAGQSILCRPAVGALRTASLNGLNAGWADSVQVTALSVEVFYRYVQGLTSGTGQGRIVWSWIDSGILTSNGSWQGSIMQGISVKWTDASSSSSTDQVGVEIEFGSGGAGGLGSVNGYQRFIVPNLFTVSSGAQKFGQLVLTFSHVGQQRTITLYHDGVQVFTRSDSGTLNPTNGVPALKAPPWFGGSVNPTAARRFWLATGYGGESFSSGTIYDQCRVWKRVLTPGEVSASYANGNPVGGLLNGQQASQLVAMWSFNTSSLSGSSGAGTQASPWSAGTFADMSGNGLGMGIMSIAGGVESQTGWVLDGGSTSIAKKARYRIQVQRRDLVRDGTSIRDLCKLDHVIAVTDAALQYPERVLLGVEIVADDQLNTNTPDVVVPVKGEMAPIWDGENPNAPNMVRQWSANPAWVAARVLTAEWGLGKVFREFNRLDVQAFKSWADWCDERVWDQKAIQGVVSVAHGSWPSGSALDTQYPDGYIEVVLAFDSVADLLPDNMQVGSEVELVATTIGGGAPAWAAALVASGVHTIVETGLTTTYVNDTIRVPWPDAAVSAPPSPTSWVMFTSSSDVDLQGREPRMRCDMVLDRRTENAWDQVMKVFNAGRAVPVKIGGRIRPKVERPRSPVALFNSSNIEPGSFRFSIKGRDEEFNSASMEILDRDRGYKREPVSLQHSSLRDVTSAQNVVERGFSAEGITRRSQAMRELRYMLNTAHLARMVIEFKTSLEGAFVEVGDVVLVSHDLPLWAFSGRCRDDSYAPNMLILDRRITLASGQTYFCAVRGGDDALAWVEVSSPAGSYVAGDVIELDADLDFTPRRDDPWTIGTTTTATRKFQVIHGSGDQDLNRSLRLIEYRDEAYDETGFPQLPPQRSELPVPTPADVPSGPSMLLASDGSGTDEDIGLYRKRLDVSWQYDPADLPRVAGALIWVAEETTDGAPARDWRQVGSVRGRTNVFRLATEDLRVGTAYRVKVQPFNASGASIAIDRLPSALARVRGRSTLVDPPLAIGIIQAGDLVSYIVQQSIPGTAASVELRRGGWLVGDRVGTIGVQADLGSFAPNWVSLPTAVDGRENPPMLARNVYTNLQRSRAYEITIEPDLNGFDAPLAQASIEDVGWTVGSPAPVLSSMVVDSSTTPPRVVFTGSGLAGSYTTTDVVLPDARLVHVSLGWEADQVHPRTWDDDAGATGGHLVQEVEADLQPGQIAGRVVGGRSPTKGWDDSWSSDLSASWSWEGPTDNLATDDSRRLSGNVLVRVTMLVSQTANPSDGVEVGYAPGYYLGRSFRFKIAITRRDATYNVWITRMAYAIRARAATIDGGDIG